MTDEEKPEDVARFSAVARNQGLWEELRNTIGAFLGDFAQFESLLLTAVFHGLSRDSILVEYLPEYMDLYYRLKLLRNLAEAYNLPDVLAKEIRAVAKVADSLRECRNDIAHGTPTLFGAGLTDPSEPAFAGVRRKRSERKVPQKAPLTNEDLLEIQRQWSHDLPTIKEWDLIAQKLCAATQVLANKLLAKKTGNPWEHMVVPSVPMPKRGD